MADNQPETPRGLPTRRVGDWPGATPEQPHSTYPSYSSDYIPPPPSTPPTDTYRPSGERPARRDPFPLVIGGLVGAILVGLVLLGVFASLWLNRTTEEGVIGAETPPAQPAIEAPTAAPSEEPPRISIEEFKKLYDDPVTRPVIIDVRGQQAYDAGHIKGAIVFGEPEVDTRASELPKDKLVVAYCA